MIEFKFEKIISVKMHSELNFLLEKLIILHVIEFKSRRIINIKTVSELRNSQVREINRAPNYGTLLRKNKKH